MVADLARFGIVPAKSLTLRWPTELPSELARDFLLGYFDGDGFITYTINNGYRYGRWGLTSGSIAFLEVAMGVVRDQTGVILGGPHKKTPAPGNTYTAYVTGLGAARLDAWIHKSGLGLARKRLQLG